MTTTPLLTVPEAAKLLTLSEQHTYRLIARGDIECVRFGRKAVRVTEAAIEAFITAKTNPVRPSVAQRRLHSTG